MQYYAESKNSRYNASMETYERFTYRPGHKIFRVASTNYLVAGMLGTFCISNCNLGFHAHILYISSSYSFHHYATFDSYKMDKTIQSYQIFFQES